MKRINLLVPEEVYEWIREQAFKLKISMAEFIRRILSEKKG